MLEDAGTFICRSGVSNIGFRAKIFSVFLKRILNKLKPSDIFVACTSGIYKVGSLVFHQARRKDCGASSGDF